MADRGRKTALKRDDQAHHARAKTDAASVAWRELRENYTPAIRELVERIISVGGFTMQDLLAMELAEHMRMLDELQSEEAEGHARLREQLYRNLLQSRKHMRMILTEMGDTGGADDQPAVVPEGLDALPKPDGGDDL